VRARERDREGGRERERESAKVRERDEGSTIRQIGRASKMKLGDWRE
jgi:hypothetical protein